VWVEEDQAVDDFSLLNVLLLKLLADMPLLPQAGQQLFALYFCLGRLPYFEQDDAQTLHVTLLVLEAGVACLHFRRHLQQGAYVLRHFHVFKCGTSSRADAFNQAGFVHGVFGELRESEVGDLDFVVESDQNVRGLQVAVDHADVVDVVEAFHDLAGV